MKLQDRPLPQPPSSTNQELYQFLRSFVFQVAAFIRDVREGFNSGKLSKLQVDVLENEPLSPVNGTLVYADGTQWNPGSGEGFYGYENGTWVKL